MKAFLKSLLAISLFLPLSSFASSELLDRLLLALSASEPGVWSQFSGHMNYGGLTTVVRRAVADAEGSRILKLRHTPGGNGRALVIEAGFKLNDQARTSRENPAFHQRVARNVAEANLDILTLARANGLRVAYNSMQGVYGLEIAVEVGPETELSRLVALVKGADQVLKRLSQEVH